MPLLGPRPGWCPQRCDRGNTHRRAAKERARVSRRSHDQSGGHRGWSAASPRYVVQLSAVPPAPHYHHRMTRGNSGHGFEELDNTVLRDKPCNNQYISRCALALRNWKCRGHLASIGNEVPTTPKVPCQYVSIARASKTRSVAHFAVHAAPVAENSLGDVLHLARSHSSPSTLTSVGIHVPSATEESNHSRRSTRVRRLVGEPQRRRRREAVREGATRSWFPVHASLESQHGIATRVI